MGFFSSDVDLKKVERGIVRNIDMLHRNGCTLCPLDRAHIYSPKMEPTGAEDPLVYMIGEAPGKTEDEQGEQFVGASGAFLRPLVPKAYQSRIRWNNTINCRPPGNRDPDTIEIECCRPRLVADIEWTKPRAIFCFGNHPLNWATGKSGISNWRGRRMPIKVGNHVCWLFPFYHPSALLRIRRGRNSDIISEDERATQFDLARAFAEVELLPTPVVHSEARAREEVVCLWGSSPGDFERLHAFLNDACAAPYAGVDYETNGKRPYSRGSRILSSAVSLPNGHTVAFAVDHREAKWSEQEIHQIREDWRRFLSSKCRKVVHGLHFELEWSAFFYGQGILHNRAWDCTISQAHVLDERIGKKVPFGLGFLTLQYFGLDIKALSHVDRKNMANEPIEEILPYNGIDAKYHRLLWEVQSARLDHEGLRNQYELMLPRVATAVATQLKGFPVDLELNQHFREQFEEDMRKAEAAIKALPEYTMFYNKFGKNFEVGKPAQVKSMILQVLKLDIGDLDDFLDNTAKSNLIKIHHPIIPLIIAYREALKLKSTYCDSIRDNTYDDGLIHQELQTTFVVTTRASSDSPNMKNLPKRTDQAKLVRKQFIAPEGHILAAVDYAQIQVRNVAMESRDPVLCKYIWEGFDMHGDWSRRIARAAPQLIAGDHTGSTEADKLKWLRQQAKSGWTFCLLFGGSLYTAIQFLQAQSKCTVEESELQPLYEEFWDTFKGVHAWHEECRKSYREKGYIENLTGFRRRAPCSANQLINAPIQADEAAMVWDAFNRLSQLGVPELQPINEIYDDLTFCLPEDSLEDCLEVILEETTKPTFGWINVPVGVEVSTGHTLYDLKHVAQFDSVELHGLPHRPNYSY